MVACAVSADKIQASRPCLTRSYRAGRESKIHWWSGIMERAIWFSRERRCNCLYKFTYNWSRDGNYVCRLLWKTDPGVCSENAVNTNTATGMDSSSYANVILRESMTVKLGTYVNKSVDSALGLLWDERLLAIVILSRVWIRVLMKSENVLENVAVRTIASASAS